MMVGRRSFPYGKATFQGRTVNFRSVDSFRVCGRWLSSSKVFRMAVPCCLTVHRIDIEARSKLGHWPSQLDRFYLSAWQQIVWKEVGDECSQVWEMCCFWCKRRYGMSFVQRIMIEKGKIINSTSSGWERFAFRFGLLEVFHLTLVNVL